MGQSNSRPEPGDLIEIDRPLYQHWALYVGDGYVIHLTPVGKKAINLGVHKVTVLTRKVKKQLLKEVVGKDKWSPNNQSDKYYTPLPVEEIIQRAEGYIGKEVTYRVFGSNCENFVKKLRYGDQRVFVHGEVHVPDMTSDNCHPKPGDLIKCTWYGGKCWALYVGDGYVIHVTVSLVDENASPVSDSSVPKYTTIVKKELLQNVVKRRRWCVKNKYDCHRPPLPVEEIIWSAECFIGKEVPEYFFSKYSEQFMAKFRYGGQAFGDREMHTPDMIHEKYYPRPGDLIEIKCIGNPHWTLYVGCGYVIHVTVAEESAAPVSASTETSFTGKAVVKKQLLKEVARNFYWEVKNESDCRYTPVPVEEIIWRAEGYIGKEVPPCFFLSKSEHFVKKLRYGDQAFRGGETHTPGMTQEKYYPKPGDLIEVKRLGYQHWAVYVGCGYVIHVTAVDESASPVSASSATLLTRRAKVKKDVLKEVAGDDDWGVNNKYDHYHTPFPMEEIVRRAERWIDVVVPYCLLLRNCEHFVTMLRYGEAVSEQASLALRYFYYISTAAAGIGAIGVSAVTTPLVAAAGVSFIANIGFASGNVVHSVSRAKFFKAEKDILQQMCC